jgi:hypothetical protein
MLAARLLWYHMRYNASPAAPQVLFAQRALPTYDAHTVATQGGYKSSPRRRACYASLRA